MAKIKEILNEAAIMAGDDQMDLYDPQQYLEWFQQFCLWVVDRVSAELYGDLIDQSASLTLTATKDEVTLPTDFAKLLSAKRDAVLCEIVTDPIIFEEVYAGSSGYFAPSALKPACSLWEEKLKVLPVGKTGNSAVLLLYVKTVGNSADANIPISIRLKPAAVAFIAGMAIAADADTEAVEAAKAHLEYAGILVAV